MDWVLTLINYGPSWRRHRRTFHQFFNAAAVQEYQPSQRREAHKFVLRLIEKPKDFVHHIRQYVPFFSAPSRPPRHSSSASPPGSLFGSTIMRITYGIEVDEPGNESYLATVEEALAIFSAATVPGKYLVETFPVLRHVPTWFPFARFKREAREWRDLPMEVLHRPWEVALHAIVSVVVCAFVAGMG